MSRVLHTGTHTHIYQLIDQGKKPNALFLSCNSVYSSTILFVLLLQWWGANIPKANVTLFRSKVVLFLQQCACEFSSAFFFFFFALSLKDFLIVYFPSLIGLIAITNDFEAKAHRIKINSTFSSSKISCNNSFVFFSFVHTYLDVFMDVRISLFASLSVCLSVEIQ